MRDTSFIDDKKSKEVHEKIVQGILEKTGMTREDIKEVSNKSVIMLSIFKLQKEYKDKRSFTPDEIANEIYYYYFEGMVDQDYTKWRTAELLLTMRLEGLVDQNNRLTKNGTLLSNSIAKNNSDYICESRKTTGGQQ